MITVERVNEHSRSMKCQSCLSEEDVLIIDVAVRRYRRDPIQLCNSCRLVLSMMFDDMKGKDKKIEYKPIDIYI
jgi:hypothetical protein